MIKHRIGNKWGSRTCTITEEVEVEFEFDPDEYINECSDEAVLREYKHRQFHFHSSNLDISYDVKLEQIKNILGLQYYHDNARVIKEIELLF